MAGFTPFQFSSRRLQMETSSSLLGKALTLGGALESPFNDLFSWYEMWVNPQSLNMQYDFLQNSQYTANSVVTYHYGRGLVKMSAKGVCGWILKQSDLGALKEAGMKGIFSLDFSSAKEQASGIMNQALSPIKNFSTFGGGTSSLNNSPRQFLERLQDIANQPMYFVDGDGIEHYNTKYIKIFTKRYPEGVICEGYYTSFEIPESADDAQTISYSFNFTVENIKPISLITRTLGMFSSAGSGVGGIARGLGL